MHLVFPAARLHIGVLACTPKFALTLNSITQLSIVHSIMDNEEKRLYDAINAFNIFDYKWTLLSVTAAVPIGLRAVPKHQKYFPLLVLGSIGGLADYFVSEARLEPHYKRLKEIQEAKALVVQAGASRAEGSGSGKI